jgi:hypothetical protein
MSARETIKQSSGRRDRFRAAEGPFALMPMMAPLARRGLQTQDVILDEMETYWRQWFKRRHEAMRTAAEAAEKLSKNGAADPAEAPRAIVEWYGHSMERVAKDAQEGMDLWARCAGHMARANVAEGARAVEAGAEEVERQAKGKSATPL